MITTRYFGFVLHLCCLDGLLPVTGFFGGKEQKYIIFSTLKVCALSI